MGISGHRRARYSGEPRVADEQHGLKEEGDAGAKGGIVGLNVVEPTVEVRKGVSVTHNARAN